MLGKLALPEVRELIEIGDRATIGAVLNDWLPADLAEVIVALRPEERVALIGAMSPRIAASSFAYLDAEAQGRLLDDLPGEAQARLLDDMAPDDRTALLGRLDPDRSGRLLARLSPAERDVARALLEYPEGTVGRLMTPDYLAVRRDWTIKQVLDHIRAHGRDSETLNVIYVTEPDGRLIDDIRSREILLAPERSRVSEIMDHRFVSLAAGDERRKAVEVFRKYDRTALPVVDDRGRLAGIVTIDDVIDVAEEESTREIQRFGGVEALEDPYMSTPLTSMVRKRASWLVILFVSEMLTATAMGYFEDEIQKAVVLALFVPLIISSGGNSGSQAATLIIRALALGEVRLGDWPRVLRRELLSGLMLGPILGTIGFLRIAAWSRFSGIYGPHWPLLGLTVGASLVGIVLWGTVSGSMLPFLLKRLGFDPATSSAPFVATLMDVAGLVIYFSVAMLILRGTLL